LLNTELIGLLLSLLGGLALGVLGAGLGRYLSSRVQRYAESVADLRQEVESLQSQLGEAQNEIARRDSEIKRLNSLLKEKDKDLLFSREQERDRAQRLSQLLQGLEELREMIKRRSQEEAREK